MPPVYLPLLKDCMPPILKALGSAWQQCGASSTGTAVGSGPRAPWSKAPPSISHWRLRRNSMPEPGIAPEPAAAKGSRQRRLLVVEDADRDYALLTRELHKAGLDVILHRVENAEQFRAALADGPWDAIVSNHSLPQFSSTVALEIAREREREVPFIIVSGAIGEEQAVDAMKAGAQDYVSKSNLRRLIPVLEREWREAEGRRKRRRAEAEIAALHRERETRLIQRSTLLDITNAVVANLDRSSLFRSIFDALRHALA